MNIVGFKCDILRYLSSFAKVVLFMICLQKKEGAFAILPGHKANFFCHMATFTINGKDFILYKCNHGQEKLNPFRPIVC